MPPRSNNNALNNTSLVVIFGFAAILIGLVLYLGQFGRPPGITDADSASPPDRQDGQSMNAQQAPPQPETTEEQPPAEPVVELVQGRPESPSQDAASEMPTAEAEQTPQSEQASPEPPPPSPADLLMQAAAAGDLDGLRTQLQAGANVNTTDALGRSALMHAAREGHLQAVFLLLDFGADPQLQDAAGRTATDHAQAHPDIQRVLRGATTPPPKPDPTK